MEICSVLQGNKKSSVCYILTVENARALIAGSVFLHYMKIPVMMQLFKYLILHVVGFNFAVHTTLWKRVICFLSTLLQRNLKTQQSPVILDLYLRKTQSGKSRDYRDVIVFEKLRFKNDFRPHENEKPAFLNSSCLNRVLRKAPFRDGLVWTVGLTVVSNFIGVVWTGPEYRFPPPPPPKKKVTALVNQKRHSNQWSNQNSMQIVFMWASSKQFASVGRQ